VRICPSISASRVSMVRSFSEIAWRTDTTSTSESEEVKRVVVFDGFCSFRAGCKPSIEVVVVVEVSTKYIQAVQSAWQQPPKQTRTHDSPLF